MGMRCIRYIYIYTRESLLNAVSTVTHHLSTGVHSFVYIYVSFHFPFTTIFLHDQFSFMGATNTNPKGTKFLYKLAEMADTNDIFIHNYTR